VETLLERIQKSFDFVAGLRLPHISSNYWDGVNGAKGDFVHDPSRWDGFRSNAVTGGLDNSNIPDHMRERVLRKWGRIYRELVPQIPSELHGFLDEVDVGAPLTVQIDGWRISQSSLEYTWMLSHLRPFMQGVDYVLEIGAGYGGLGRILRTAYPHIGYVALDLPEASAIQAWYLGRTLPSDRLVLAAECAEGPLSPADLRADVVIAPGQWIERVPDQAVGLVINTRSMMEMDQRTVDFYMGQIQRVLKTGGRFYCLNRYQKYTRLKDYPFDEHWYASLWQAWPTFIDANPHHEIVAIRTEHPVINGVRQMLRTLPPSDAAVARLARTAFDSQPKRLRNAQRQLWARLHGRNSL
jgi:putative sugar O-methyltransferase